MCCRSLERQSVGNIFFCKIKGKKKISGSISSFFSHLRSLHNARKPFLSNNPHMLLWPCKLFSDAKSNKSKYANSDREMRSKKTTKLQKIYKTLMRASSSNSVNRPRKRKKNVHKVGEEKTEMKSVKKQKRTQKKKMENGSFRKGNF